MMYFVLYTSEVHYTTLQTNDEVITYDTSIRINQKTGYKVVKMLHKHFYNQLNDKNKYKRL